MQGVLFLAAWLTAGVQADLQGQGLRALDQHDYQKAADIFKQLTTAHPDDYSAFFNLALAETELKEDELAAADFKHTLELKPNLYEAELNLGMLYVRDGKPQDSIPLLEAAAKQKPDRPQPKHSLAEAELEFGQSLERDGKLDAALSHYKEASTLDPKLRSYLEEIAMAFSKANRPEDAVNLLKEFPDDAGAREELGRLYLTLKQPEDAVAQFEAAVQLSPSSANRLALATAYLKNNQPEKAAPILERAAGDNPNDYDVQMAIGRIRRDRHDYQVAANQFLTAAKIKPDSVEAWNEAATSLVLANQYPQALGALDKVRDLNAEKPGNFYLRAMVLDKLHQVKPALASYQRFLEATYGEFPDQEFIARQRVRILEKEASR